MQNSHKRLSQTEALQKILAYCAYQERNHQEVKNKLFGFGLFASEVNEMIVHLITEGFLNEERFARSFVGGKFRVKNWGRIKIVHALEAKGLTKNCIQSGMQEIEERDYQDTLQKILVKKSAQWEAESSYVKRNKLASYAIHKGFEAELVWKFVKEIVEE